MKLIDIHAHLGHSKFKKDIDKVIENAKKKNMIIITSGVNKSTNRQALELSEKYKIVKPSFGIYPIDALANEMQGEAQGFLRDIEKFDVDQELVWIEKNKDKCVAIGEVGLDYNWQYFEKEAQKRVFEKIIKLAIKLDKPLIVHSRKAELDALELLEKYKVKKVVMHCFSAKKSLVSRVIANNWFLSIPPVIKRLLHFQMVVEMCPIAQLLTETDSPYLSPVAGERNEPANVQVTIEEIARIKGMSKDEVADKIWDNAKKLFNL